MTVYYVDDGGSSTSPYDTWAKAASDIWVLDTAVSLAAGDIIYIGHNSVDSRPSANKTLVGPSSSITPCRIISATQGSSPVTYQQATSQYQIATANNYSITFNGSWSLSGVNVVGGGSGGGGSIAANNTNQESFFAENCTFELGHAGVFTCGGHIHMKNSTVALNDTANTSSIAISATYKRKTFENVTVASGGYRVGYILAADTSLFHSLILASGLDVSSCNNVSPPTLFRCSGYNDLYASNIKTASSYTLFDAGYPYTNSVCSVQNYGTADAPAAFAFRSTHGDVVASTSIYRTGGAELNGVATAWLVTTQSDCYEYDPFFLPWMYATLDSTGSKTFDVYITNDSADLTDAEIWLEVDYLTTSGSNVTQVDSDHRTITTTAANQTDDTSSTWNGSGPSFTYKQKLSVTATVGQAGIYRARVVVGKTSVASSAYLYVDPKVTVS